MERSAVVEWLFCEHRRIVCGERDHQKIYRESRKKPRENMKSYILYQNKDGEEEING